MQYSPGNQAEFTTIFRFFYNALCRFANKILKDWPAAEDIAVDVFIKLWSSQREFNCGAAIKQWLYKCTYHDCIDHLNKNKRTTNLVPELVEHNNKEREIIKLEELAALRSLVSRLPLRCKNIIKLHYFIGLDNQQIASLFAISPHTVKNQKARGIYLIKESLNGKNTWFVRAA